MVICATSLALRRLATLRTLQKPNVCSVCATLKGGAAQGVAPAHAQLRHLRHPLIGWPRWSGAVPGTEKLAYKLDQAGGAQ
jgi:hypothetical protein